MTLDPVEGLGLIAGFIGSFAFAPQAIKLIRDRQAEGVSTLTYAMVLSGACLWGVYGLLRESVALTMWNFVAGGLAAAVLIVKAQVVAKARRELRDK